MKSFKFKSFHLNQVMHVEFMHTKTSAYQAVKLGPLSWDNVKQHWLKR